MIWTFVGERKQASKDINKLLALLHKKQPDAEELHIDGESFEPSQIDELIGSQGLFSPKYIIVLENIDLKEKKGEGLVDKLKEIKESEHAFLAYFPKLLAAEKKRFEKFSFEYKEYEPSTKLGSGKKENSFEMADKIGERDVIGLWYIFAQKITDEVSPEEIHGMFVWQIKGILLALKTKTASEAGMNDYPYTKAKRYAKNFTQKELEDLLFQLIQMYDKAHSGKADLKVELERWVLRLGKK